MSFQINSDRERITGAKTSILGTNEVTIRSGDGNFETEIFRAQLDPITRLPRIGINRSGNRVEQTEWHDLELWDQQAKIAEKYLKKGSQIYVEGKIKSDKWTDEQGQNRKRMKIRVLNFTMLGGKPDGMPSNPPAAAPAANSAPLATAPQVSLDEGDDDLPF